MSRKQAVRRPYGPLASRPAAIGHVTDHAVPNRPDSGRMRRNAASTGTNFPDAATGPARDSAPEQVPGPFGVPLTRESLPPINTRRWVVRRKAEVLAAIHGGLLTAADACSRYGISPEELELWQRSLDRAGIAGLRVTRIQLYQSAPPQRDAARPARLPERHRWDLSRS